MWNSNKLQNSDIIINLLTSNHQNIWDVEIASSLERQMLFFPPYS